MNFINPVIVTLGPFEIRWYGVLIMTGVALGCVWGARLAKKRGLDPDHVWSLIIVAVILAILGARLYHVVSTPAGCPPDGSVACGWPYYRHHFFEAFAIWRGGFQGLGIYGAILGGIVGVVLYAVLSHLRPLEWLDLGAPGLAFGQFVGRWGNFVNQELYGPPTGSTWFGLRINRDLPHQPLPEGTDYSTLFHPLFLYESLWCLVVFAVLYTAHSRLRRFLRDGDVILGYIVLYSFGRFFIEFLRGDAWRIGALATAQWIAIGCIAGGVAAITLRHIFWKRPAAAPEPAAETVTPTAE